MIKALMVKALFHNRYLNPVARMINSRLPAPIARVLYQAGRTTGLPDARQPYFERVFRHIAEHFTDGDYLEFGVFRGRSFKLAYEEAQRNNLNKIRFFAFDGFVGLP